MLVLDRLVPAGLARTAVPAPPAGVDLYWLPLGAGGHSVRVNGKVFEAVAAFLEGRARCDLYHSALHVTVPEGRFVVEQAPARREGTGRGVVGEGAVGSRAAARLRLFRYEVRRWRDGVIPDIAEAVASPRRLTEDPSRPGGCSSWCLRRQPRSGAAMSWVQARCGTRTRSSPGSSSGPARCRGDPPPEGGRAPGWSAGVVVARRDRPDREACTTARSP